MRISVPASSANLGSGFDALGLALDVPFLLSTRAAGTLLAVEGRHPAGVAFAEAGGRGELWWRSPIPPGRGMGFSGAARVAGAFAGFLQQGMAVEPARTAALWLAATLEGHPDNAAASALGGFTVAAGGHAVRVPIAFDARVVVWWPAAEVATSRARAALPAEVGFADAVFNVGRAALLVAALAAGDRAALAVAAEDRLHQQARLALSPASGRALEALWRAGPLAAWLGGSGPTVAALVDPADAERVAGALPPDGTFRVLRIDTLGARVLGEDSVPGPIPDLFGRE